MLAAERARRAHTRKDADAAQPRVIDIDAFAGPRSSRTSLSPGTVAGAPAVGAGTRITGAAVTGVRAASFPVRLTGVSGVVHAVPVQASWSAATLATAMQNREVGASPTRSSPL